MDIRDRLDDLRYAVVDQPLRAVAVAGVVVALLLGGVFGIRALLGPDGPVNPGDTPLVSQADGDCADLRDEMIAFTSEHTYGETNDDETLAVEYQELYKAFTDECPVYEQDVLYNTVLGSWLLTEAGPPEEQAPVPAPAEEVAPAA